MPTENDYKDYYKSQLSKLSVKGNAGYVNMKLHSDNGETKHLGVNKDSIIELLDFCIKNDIVTITDIYAYSERVVKAI